MNIDLKNPGHVKLLLLSRGVHFTDTDLLDVGSKYAENRYYYNISNNIRDFKNPLPSTILLPDGVEANLYFNPLSELRIKLEGKALGLFYNDEFLCKVGFISRPAFFDQLVNEKVQCKQVLSMYGRHTLGIFSNAYCTFFKRGLQCKFCSLKPARSSAGKDNLLVLTPALVREAVKIALKMDREQIKYILYTSGTHSDEEKSYQEQAAIIRAVSQLNSSTVAHHITISPTLREDLLKDVHGAGLSTICFTLEVFDRKLFKEYCPGKDQCIGYDNFMRAYKLARGIFGHCNVNAGFVGGLEPLESLEQGMHFFGKLGVGVAINVFHPDPNTPLSDRPRPTVDYLFQMVRAQSKVYKQYKLKPLFPIGGRRSSLDAEVFRGFFD